MSYFVCEMVGQHACAQHNSVTTSSSSTNTSSVEWEKLNIYYYSKVPYNQTQ